MQESWNVLTEVKCVVLYAQKDVGTSRQLFAGVNI